MFKNHGIHESGIKKSYISNIQNRTPKSIKRLKLQKKGARVWKTNTHLERKVTKCYPRGKAWLRMVDLNTARWCTHSTGHKID